ncbi:hypothetical protein PL10110_190025 [Planktothrix agardhii]|nr:hypothetical protein PL10110_190025 [Planktothrix agardhii]
MHGGLGGEGTGNKQTVGYPFLQGLVLSNILIGSCTVITVDYCPF